MPKSGSVGRCLALLLLLGASAPALATSYSCGTDAPSAGTHFGGVIDGSIPAHEAAFNGSNQLQFTGPCTVKNFTCPSNPFTPTINFFGSIAPSLIVFDNVCFTGNMSCANQPNALMWITNGSDFSGVKESCQDMIIPVEKIDKQSPAATATVGVPFTYTLTIPIMYIPNGSTYCTENPTDPACQAILNFNLGSPNELGNIHIWDDLTAAATGAEMTLVGLNLYWKGTANPVPYTTRPTHNSKYIDIDITGSIPPNAQIIMEVTVTLDNVAGNAPGTPFVNTAKWEFSRSIDVNENGTIEPEEFFTPLPGEWGVSPPMTIAGPDFVVTKDTGGATSVNPSTVVTYTVDAQNTGGWEAWNVTLTDILPADTTPGLAPDQGMCKDTLNPITFGSGVCVWIEEATGTPVAGGPLASGTDYIATWGGETGPNACKLTVTLTDLAGPVAPNFHLVMSYQGKLDDSFITSPPPGGTTFQLINVAGATQWYNAPPSFPGRSEINRVLTDGTPASSDFQDNAAVTAAVSGYYFEKTVNNQTTGETAITTAAPGDRLHYVLHLFNVNQTIQNIDITDALDAGSFNLASATVTRCEITGPAAPPVQPLCSIAGNVLTVTGNGGPLELPVLDDLVVEFEVDLLGTLTNSTVVSNQATLAATGITSQAGPYVSDDPFSADAPYTNAVADPTVPGDENPTRITIVAPGPLTKANPAQTEVAVGESFSYQITVPAATVASPLFDVHVLDTLPANLRFVSATVLVNGNTLNLANIGTGQNLELVEPATGIDIPAGEQAVVTLNVLVDNIALNQNGQTFSNTASYSYSRSNGGTQSDPAGTEDSTTNLTVVEAQLAISKTVSNISSPGNPAQGGDVLEYVVTLNNSGTATAFDTGIEDTLPPELALEGSFVPTATIDGVGVPGFIATPANLGGTLAWGRGNTDGSLDIPEGKALVLTYRVTVVSVIDASIDNSVFADWTSLDQDNGVDNDERTGAGVPDTTALNNYFTGPVTTSLTSQDTTAFAKAYASDTWSADGSTGTDSILRVGDTATYTLTLTLREGQTAGVVVTDTLPAGLALDSFTLTNGANITYTPVAQPAAGATGTLTWNLGTITNAPDIDATNDTLVIEYVARVVANSVDTIAQAATTTRTNNAQLAYTDAAAALPGTDSIDVRQPVLGDLAKSGTVTNTMGGDGSAATPYLVDLASSVATFHLETCNAADPAAPAYGVVISDTLATQFDETSLTAPVVTVNGIVQTAGVGYVYTAPAARGGSLNFVLNTPVNPGQCASVDYSVGLYTDVATTTAWSNTAGLTDYYSLPANAGQHYTNTVTDAVWMRNASTPLPPVKVLSPVISAATIGQSVTYTITVPADNIIRNSVVVTDTLPLELAFDSATVSIGGSLAAPIANGGAGQNLVFNLGTIPAGQNAVITLTTHVANTADSNAGDSSSNTAAYTYTGYAGPALTVTSAPFTVIEPLVALDKTANVATAVAGNVITYTVSLTASAGANFSDAFDLVLTDTLGAGINYVLNSSTVDGTPVPDPVIAGSTLTWPARNIAEGATVVVSYQVLVQDSVLAGQTLTNNASATWTSLNGASANERNGSGGVNDYLATDTTTVTVPAPVLVLDKSRVSDSFNAADANLRVGDTVDYRLRIDLQDGSYNGVTMTDTLPAGLAFDSMVSATFFGTAAAPAPAPAVAGQTLTWTLGNRVNPAELATANDYLELVYRARVLTNTLTQSPTSQALLNTGAFSYQGATQTFSDDDTDTVTVLQPLMGVTKSDRLGRVGTAGSPLQVDVANDVMQFRLEACNTGNAPSYATELVDTLAPELDETSLTTPVVTVNGVGQTDGVGYVYTAPAVRGGTLNFVFNTAVNPGQCARVDYNIGFHTDVAANQIWNNSVSATEYWSLPAAAGQQYPAVGPAEFWMTNASIDQLPVKTLTSAATATIGDTVSYEIAVPLANGVRNNVTVNDTLPAELTFVSATVSIDGGAATPLVNAGTASVPSLNIGTLQAGEAAVVTLLTRVVNTVDSNAGDSVTNTASYTYATLVTPVTGLPSSAVTVIEPLVALDKTASTATAVAGDVITYTVNLTASSGANFSEAFDLVLTDTLGAGLAYVAGSSTINAVAVPDPAIAGSTLTWPARNIAEGATVVVTYQVLVQDSVVGGQTLTNNASATWTSLNGVNANERNGSGGVNDYLATDTTTVTVPSSVPLFSKVVASDTYVDAVSTATDATVRPGDFVEYELHIGLPQGTHTDLVLKDTLPAGLTFDSTVSATYFGVAGPLPAFTQAGQALTWTLGNRTNPAGSPSDEIVIRYRALVVNTLTQTNTTTLANSATLDYTVAAVAQPQLTASQNVTVHQPTLAVDKSALTQFGDTAIVAGEVVTYTVDIANNGTAPAYDSVLTDTLPAGMRNTGGPVATSITLVNAGTVLPVLQPVYVAATGVATWNFDNNAANTYTIPAGETLRVTYTVAADADLGASLTLGNSAVAPLYYSFDDEAVPVPGVVENREQYGPTNTDVATLTTVGPAALSKSTATTTGAIGDEFTYTITVPAAPVATALSNVHILDTLPANLGFVSATVVVNATTLTLVDADADPSNGLDLVNQATGTGINIPASQTAVATVTVRVLDVAPNTAGQTFSNTATYTYSTFTGDPATLGATSTAVTVTEPMLVMTKTGPATMAYGTPAQFTLDVENTGTATAWDITLTDHLPNLATGGMCAAMPTAIAVTVNGTPLTLNTDYTVGFTGSADGTPCTFTLTGLTALAAVAPTQHMIVTYTTTLDIDTQANVALTNYAGATQWFSQDDTAAVRRTYTHALVDAIETVADAQDDHTITSAPPVMRVEKTVGLQNDVNGDGSANPGDTLRYTVTITNDSPVVLPNFSLVDDLGALNATAVFVPGSLVVSNAAGGNDLSNATGGSNSQGLVDIRNLTLGAQATPTGVVTVTFDVTLAGAIDNGTVVLNQGAVFAFGSELQKTDDPANPATSEDPTPVTVVSAPVWLVQKISDDITGDAGTLLPGDTLRYTITVQNNGNENAINVALRDLVPSFTTYVANTTTLNGVAVADAAAGVSPLQNGMTINAPGNTTPGAMDASPAANNIATITFNVTVNASAVSGTIINNQGFVNGTGAGGTAFQEKPSNDPATTVADDPTRDIVGSLPLVDAQKTVALVDQNGDGVVNAGDTLRYTITVSNTGTVPATGVVLNDTLPAGTTYIDNSTTLNALAYDDSAFTAGSVDVTIGTVAGGASATVVFDVTVGALAAGTVISNQGSIDSVELPVELTDADGIDSNGDQPTTIVVGSDQQLEIVKEVTVVGGGTALPGSVLEYTVRVTNTGTVPATQVVISDDISALPATYVAGSARLNGATAGVNASTPLITADYGTAYGVLQPGATATLTFRVTLAGAPTLAAGDTVSNTGTVTWNALPPLSATASIAIGAIPGTATLNGLVWHDANFNNSRESTERLLAGWTVQVYRSGTLLGSTTTDANGAYSFAGLAPTVAAADQYELRFRAPGAGATSAMLGVASSGFSNFLQRISAIVAGDSSSVQNLNLPIDPNGVVYNSILRTPVAGATLTLVNATSGVPVAATCFDDPNQQGQVTTASGFYKFDLNFSDASCAAGGSYLIQVTAPGNGFAPGVSRVIAPLSDATTAAYSVPVCASDAIGLSGECEAVASENAPAAGVPAASAPHYLHLQLSNTTVPGDSQLFNNHIPLDPRLGNAVSIRKTSALVNVSRGEIVPYVITVGNTLPVALADIRIVDTFPAGFKYVAGSARVNGVAVEPAKGNRDLTWNALQLPSNTETTIKLLFVVGAGVNEGAYINRAQVFNAAGAASGEATATVRVIPDPTFDCSDVIGKVFDDANVNGVQDNGEKGLPGVRLATARGLLVTTDDNGRYHLTCVTAPDENRGANFIVKVDDRTLPTGYRLTTENPLVQRLTRGKLAKFNFGAALHRVVRLDLASGVFVPGSSEMRPQWQTRFALLVTELKKGPSTLRLAYMAETEDDALVQQRLEAVRRELAKLWSQQGQPYELSMETEVFWRTGAPPARRIAK